MRRDLILTLTVVLSALLLLLTSTFVDLRSPEGTAELGRSLAEEPVVRDAVTDALVEALLADAAERSPVAGGLLSLIRPLLEQAALSAAESPAGRAALASALTDAVRQLTFSGPIVVDLRAAALIAADTAPAPLDTLARTAVEQGGVGVVVLGGAESGTPDGPPEDRTAAPPTEDELGRIAGLPARVALLLAALLLIALIITLIGRDAASRPRRLLLAGASLLVVGAGGVSLLHLAPQAVVERMAGAFSDDPGLVGELLPLLMDGLVGLLGPTTSLSGLLALLGVGLGTAGALSAAGRRRTARAGRAAPAPTPSAPATARAAASATERFRTLAAELGVDVEPSEFPQGTRTAVDAAAAVGCDVAAIVKSLVFMVDGGAVLVLTSGANRVDERRLAQELGASEVRKASADEARAATGYAIGGTPPFGHTGDGLTAVLLDPALLEHDRVWAAAGTPSSVFPIAPARLAEVAGARTADVTLAGPA